MFEGYVKSDSRDCQKCFKDVLRVLQWCIWVYHVRYKGVSSVFHGCFKGVKTKIQKDGI